MHIVDMHCDTISELALSLEKKDAYAKETQNAVDRRAVMSNVIGDTLRMNSRHVDLTRMKDAGYLLQNFALFVNKQKYPNVKKRVLELMDYYQAAMAQNADLISPVTCMADIERNGRQGKISAMLTLEEGAALEGSIDTLKEFYDKGVRMITLTWNYPNELGFPHSCNDKSSGLTACGFEMVEAMESLGVIVDVSHLSDEGFYDVLRCTKRPFVASHSNARAVCDVSRNLTDEMIRALAERGGVMGLNFYPPFLEKQKAVGCASDSALQGTVESVINHAKHIVKVGGIEVLGLGSDFDGIDGHKELPGVHAMPRLIDVFAKSGFCASDIDKIFSGNVLRVYNEVLD